MKPAIALLLVALGACSVPQPQAEVSAANAGRGELLYENACGACHTTEPHWREKRLVGSWNDLVGQVRRWQAVAGQNWSPAEVNDVAAFLNERFYRLPLRRAPG